MRCWADVRERPGVGDVVVLPGAVRYEVTGVPVTKVDLHVDARRTDRDGTVTETAIRMPFPWGDLVDRADACAPAQAPARVAFEGVARGSDR